MRQEQAIRDKLALDCECPPVRRPNVLWGNNTFLFLRTSDHKRKDVRERKYKACGITKVLPPCLLFGVASRSFDS